MRILWITNILLPDISARLNIKPSFGGGWMFSSLTALRKECPENEFAVLNFSNICNKFIKEQIGDITYYVLPEFREKNFKLNACGCKKITEDFNPDVIHIHGTEKKDGYLFYCNNPDRNYIVSIQGLVSVYSSYYLSQIDRTRLLRLTSLYEILKGNSLFSGKKSYQIKGRTEIKYIQSINNVIGRTEWDKAHVWAINPNATYHFCNETLRPSFYDGKWSYESCEPHTIFISQAKNPIKGFHQLIKALPLVIREFPDTKVYVGSSLNYTPETLKEKIKMSSYAKYIKSMIEEYKIGNRIFHYNGLSEDEMRHHYLRCNVFISPSSIENSPNSVGEAQLLGVPVITSYVGGVSNMVEHNITGYIYRYDEPELLAYYICKIFNNDYPSDMLDNEQETAKKRHDPQTNAKKLLNIYYNLKNGK